MLKVGDKAVRLVSVPFHEEVVEVVGVVGKLLKVNKGFCCSPTCLIPVDGFTGPFGEGGRRAARPDFYSYQRQALNGGNLCSYDNMDFLSSIFFDIFLRSMRMREGDRVMVFTDHIAQSFHGEGFSIVLFFGRFNGEMGVGLRVYSEAPDKITLEDLTRALWGHGKKPEIFSYSYRLFCDEALNEMIDYLRTEVGKVLGLRITPAQRERG